MATTKTQVVQKPYSKPQRTYDYLYGICLLYVANGCYKLTEYLDPIHTLSSSRDHAKLSFKAQSSFDRLVSDS